MKTKHSILLSGLLAAVTALVPVTSCQKAELSAADDSTNDARVRFSSRSLSQMQTKAVTETTLSSLLTGGFRIVAERSDGSYMFKEKATHKDGVFEPENGPYYFPYSDSLNFYAVYPATEYINKFSGISKIPYFRESDLDLVAARAMAVTRQSSAVELEFKHILSQAKITCTGDDPNMKYKVSSVSINATAVAYFNLVDWAWEPLDSKAEIEFLSADKTLSGTTAMGETKSSIPGSYKFTVTYGCYDSSDILVGSYSKSTVVSLAQGKICTINATLPNDEASLIKLNVSMDEWDSQTESVDFTPSATFAVSGLSSVTLPSCKLKNGAGIFVEWGDGSTEDFSAMTKSSQSGNSISLTHTYSSDYTGPVKLYISGGTAQFLNVPAEEKAKFTIFREDDVEVKLPPKALRFSSTGSNSIKMKDLYSNNPVSLEYSFDGEEWNTWDKSALKIGGETSVFIRGNNPGGFNKGQNQFCFFETGNRTDTVKVEGNVMHLLNYESDLVELPCSYCFSHLFRDIYTPLDASGLLLPATKLTDYCYTFMFGSDSKLTSFPELPADSLAAHCYQQMFYGCSSLTACPELPATKMAEYCYSSMFDGCTGIIATPELPAMEVMQDSYARMFLNCTKLVTGPSALPATKLGIGSYSNMFSGCSALKTIPDILPAEIATPSCYSYMFQYCSSITKAPVIQADSVSFGSFRNMFAGCSALEEVQECLPATTMAMFCYTSMFGSCKALKKAPVLPALTLKDYCYQGMFNGCTSLNYIKMMATDISAESCLSSWIYNLPASGTFVKNAAASWNTSGKIPSGWTVETATE